MILKEIAVSNREEFEQLEDIKDILNDHKIFFNEKEDRYQAEIITGDDSVYYPSWEITYMNGAWYAWQAAKAQAVPEGFVLVPKTNSDKGIESMAMRYRHDFPLLDADYQEGIKSQMRQLYEEAVGLGFYSHKVQEQVG